LPVHQNFCRSLGNLLHIGKVRLAYLEQPLFTDLSSTSQRTIEIEIASAKSSAELMFGAQTHLHVSENPARRVTASRPEHSVTLQAVELLDDKLFNGNPALSRKLLCLSD
jgi:hypothetical protein